MSDKDVMLDGKPLQSLCLADLKAASEQRCLPKSGTKRALINRLKRTLMLENLQRTSTHHGGHQPNSRIGEEMSQNSFIKQYLAKQQELLRQRLEREAREAAEANESPAGSDLEKEGLTEVVNDSPSYCPNKETHSLSVQVLEDFKPRGLAPSAPPHSQGTEDTSLADGRQPTHSVLHLSRSAWAASRASVVKCLKDNSDEDDDSVEEDEEEWGPVAGARRGGGVGGGRAPQLKQPYPNVPAARERSRRKLQPPQHIPPQQVVHQPTMPLRQPTPPPSPPPELSFPLPETPKQSTPNMDEEPEAAGVAVRLLPGGFQKQDSDSSSRSSSPELLAQRRPGSLLARKMASEEVFEKRGERASDNPTDPIKVSRLEEEGFGESSRKKVSMPVKQDIIRLKHEKKSIRDIAKTLGLSKSTVWYIVKKQERTGELSDRKRPGRPQKTTLVDDQQMLAIVKKNPFSTVEHIKNTLQDLGIVVSKSTIKRRLHQHNFCVYHKTPTTESQAGPDDVEEEGHTKEVNDSPYYCPDKPEEAGVAVRLLSGGLQWQDSDSSSRSRSSSPEPLAQHRPGPLSLLARKMVSEGVFEKRESQAGPDDVEEEDHTEEVNDSPYYCPDKPEEAGVAVHLLPGDLQWQDSDSSSRSSSPEPLAQRRPGPLSLLARKMASEGVLEKRGERALDNQIDPVEVSRLEERGLGESSSKKVSMPVKQDIIRLKHQKKSIRDIAKTLGLSKSTVWNIVKKQERTGELGDRKRPGRPQKTTLVDDQQMLAIVKKNPFSTVEQIKNSLQDLGIVVSTSTIRRRLHQHNFCVYHKTPTTSKTQQQNSQGTVCVWTDEMVNMYLSDENSKAGPDDVAEENLIEEVNDSPYYCPDKNPHSLSVRVLEDVEHQGLAPSIPPHSQEKEDTALADDNQPTHSMLHLSHQPSRDSAANRLHGDNDNSEVNEEEWGPAAGARRGGSAPQPQQPSPSVHVLSDMDEEQEEAGVAVRLLPGGLQRQDCESSSRSSSPEPQAHKRSKGVLGKTRKGASDSQTDPVDVSRPEKSGDGDSNCKTVSMPLKQDIIRLKHENKSIRDIAKTLGLSKSTVWYIVKKQERTGELSNRKRPGRPQKTTLVDDQQMLAIVKKNPFSTVEQIKNSLQDLGIVVSKSTIRRRLHQHNLWV
ncbi:uncharacterized protein LOC114830399 [Esox lucius]|uniref:SAP domain-containing protein n=1 Tax=Esox lucius TaxID=8010 RepID=A0AAY5KEN9_ESOLU|nr:uncharacterized protein LOC114830399 [Esox lucius]